MKAIDIASYPAFRGNGHIAEHFLYEASSFTLLHVSLAPYAVMSPHCHQRSDEFVFQMEGQGKLRYGDYEHHLMPMEGFQINTGISHAFTNLSSQSEQVIVRMPSNSIDDVMLCGELSEAPEQKHWDPLQMRYSDIEGGARRFSMFHDGGLDISYVIVPAREKYREFASSRVIHIGVGGFGNIDVEVGPHAMIAQGKCIIHDPASSAMITNVSDYQLRFLRIGESDTTDTSSIKFEEEK